MRILKFCIGNPFPDVYYFNEVLRLSSVQDYEIKYKQTFIENILFKSIAGSRYNYSLSESLNLKDTISHVFETLLETLGINAEEFRAGWGYFSDTIQLQDTCYPRMVYSITINENIGLAESGSVSLQMVDYLVTWRTRTRDGGVGYGKAGYGISQNYGEGSCNDIASFQVKVYNNLTNVLKRTIDIPIADRANPDNDATYTYTYSLNITDNITFQPNIKFEVFQIDNLGGVSPAANIDISPIPI
jgi:hypothetical protein